MTSFAKFLGGAIAAVVFTCFLLSFGTVSQARTKDKIGKAVTIALVNNFSDFKSPCGDPQGRNFENAVRMALRDFEMTSERFAGKIKLRKFDYGSSVLNAEETTLNAIASGAVAIVGYPCSSYAVLGAPIAEKAGVVMVTPSATIDSLTEGKRYVFRAAFKDEYQAKAMAKFLITEKKKSNAVIIANADYPYCMNMSDKFSYYFSKYGGRILKKYHVLSSKSDFSDVIDDLKLQGSDVVFIPNHEMESSVVVGQLLDADVNVTIAGGDGWGNLYGYIFPKYIGDKALDAYAIAHWSLDSQDESSQAFRKRYYEQYGDYPNDNSALAYDAMAVTLQALNRADTLDREGLRKALADMDGYDGVTGYMKYRGGDGTPFKTIYIVKYPKRNLECDGLRRFVVHRKIEPDV
jgi:branched-chain amino acid transport system substrate-binding protein